MRGAPPVLDHIVAQHAEDAAFLWLLRDRAATGAAARPRELARLDARIEAHVDGLRVAGERGWGIVLDALRHDPEPGEAFAATVLALEAEGVARLEAVLDLAGPALAGVIGALAWVEARHLQGKVAGLLADRRPLRRLLGLAACGGHRVDPGPRLAAALADPAPEVRARAARLAGELGRADLRPALREMLAEPELAFAAGVALRLLGEREESLTALQSRAGSDPQGWLALRLAVWSLPAEAARSWLAGLGQAAERLRIAGAGLIGDPAAVAWLIWRMREPAHARLAAEAVSAITGLDWQAEGLAQRGPEDLGEDLDSDARRWDADLPWPDPAAAEGWWAANRARFTPGAQLFLGHPRLPGPIDVALAQGFQRQRGDAAYLRALLRPGAPLADPAARLRQ